MNTDLKNADLRKRVARAIADTQGNMDHWQAFLPEADAVLAALASEPQAEPVGEVNPRCGVRWYSRNIPRAGTKLYAAPQPQASAEDIALVDEVMRGWPKFYEAWQRIRADYVARGVVK